MALDVDVTNENVDFPGGPQGEKVGKGWKTWEKLGTASKKLGLVGLSWGWLAIRFDRGSSKGSVLFLFCEPTKLPNSR